MASLQRSSKRHTIYLSIRWSRCSQTRSSSSALQTSCTSKREMKFLMNSNGHVNCLIFTEIWGKWRNESTVERDSHHNWGSFQVIMQWNIRCGTNIRSWSLTTLKEKLAPSLRMLKSLIVASVAARTKCNRKMKLLPWKAQSTKKLEAEVTPEVEVPI